MRIYTAEKESGLQDKIFNKDGLGIAKICTKITPSASVVDYIKKNKKEINQFLKSISSKITNIEDLIGQNQSDLAFVSSILASVGWNLNDDIFTPGELWKARHSAKHKPMNYMHDGSVIVGHIVQSFAVDKFGNEITEDNAPDDFDIEVAGVLYKAIPEISTLIEGILSKANNGEMFVSMECWFPDFDYGIKDQATGQTKIVERNESTAFLTKHLRVFDGSGEFNGQKIGRVLKDFIFGGQGFVTDPANPESVIKIAATKNEDFYKVNLDEIKTNVSKGGVVRMDEDIKKEFEKQLKEKDNSIAELTKKIVDMEKANEQKVSEIQSTFENGNKVLAEQNKKLQEEIDSLKNENKKVSDEAKANKENAEKVSKELSEIRKDQKARERLSKLSAVKTIESEKDTLAELKEMSDETFDLVIKYASKAKDSETKETKEDKTDDKSEQDNSATAALENAQPKDEADLNTGSNSTDNDTEIALALAHTLTKNRYKEEGGE